MMKSLMGSHKLEVGYKLDGKFKIISSVFFDNFGPTPTQNTE